MTPDTWLSRIARGLFLARPAIALFGVAGAAAALLVFSGDLPGALRGAQDGHGILLLQPGHAASPVALGVTAAWGAFVGGMGGVWAASRASLWRGGSSLTPFVLVPNTIINLTFGSSQVEDDACKKAKDGLKWAKIRLEELRRFLVKLEASLESARQVLKWLGIAVLALFAAALLAAGFGFVDLALVLLDAAIADLVTVAATAAAVIALETTARTIREEIDGLLQKSGDLETFIDKNCPAPTQTPTANTPLNFTQAGTNDKEGVPLG
ncbi:MAG: hypothetical protein LC623_09125 [Halobacteriales archaeon]|nr:hypothetical protein [Halobacteriales archaeon]